MTTTGSTGSQGRSVTDERAPGEARASAVLRIELVLDERTLQDVSRAIATAYDVMLSIAPERALGEAGHFPSTSLPTIRVLDGESDHESAREREPARRQVAEEPRPGEALTFGDLRVDFGAHEVWRKERRVSLRPREFALLRALIRANGCALTREQLLREVWGYTDGVFSRTLDTHVRSLRRKLEDDPAAPRHLLTVRTVGYRFAP